MRATGLPPAAILLLAGDWSSAAENPPPVAESDAAKRPRVVLVQPLVVCDDDGTNPARSFLPIKMVDQVYTHAGLEFLYLEPRQWRHGAARRGEINLDRIVSIGRSSGVIPADPRVVTLIHVSAVDGNPRPLGRGMQNGNICFISAGTEQPMTDPAMRAFVVAHEVGHCLGLRHAVDDPAVPDDVPNLQGDGPFEQRLAADGLHPSQVATVLKSPLVTERVKFLTRAEAAATLADDGWFPYLDATTTDMLRFTLGLAPDAPIPREKPEKTAFIRDSLALMADEFTPAETRMLDETVTHIRGLLDGRWPMYARLPWHFLKVKEGYSRNLPHTRGMVTVLSAAALRRMIVSPEMALTVLFHEKIHVVQRLNPDRFTRLYQTYGYTPLKLAGGEAERLNLIQNPDAPVHDWAALLPSGPVLIATAFQRVDESLEFNERYLHLTLRSDGTASIGGDLADTAEIDRWRNRFPIRIGYDHPNEVFAYLCGGMLGESLETAPVPADDEVTRATKQALETIFRMDGE